MQDLKIERNGQSLHVDRCFVNGNAGGQPISGTPATAWSTFEMRHHGPIRDDFIRNGGLGTTLDRIGTGSSQEQPGQSFVRIEIAPVLCNAYCVWYRWEDGYRVE
jgi:hypothetical protein